MLSNCVIAITGKFWLPRDDLTSLIELNGGSVVSTVKKGVTHLVVKDPSRNTAKLAKAKEMGINIVGETFLQDAFQKGLFPEREEGAAEAEPKKKRKRDDSKNPLQGKIITITGRLSKPKSHYEAIINANGGTYSATMTKKVTHVVAKQVDGASTKLERARKLGIKVVPETFLSGLPEAPKRPTASVDGGDDPNTPLHVMNDGDVVQVPGSGGTHEIRFSGGVYYCSCMAWKMQKNPVDKRTCKHMRKYLGDAFETNRVGSVAPIVKPTNVKEGAYKVLLAKKWTEGQDPTGWWLSEKYDGVRAYWDGKEFWSRLGNRFYAPDWFKADFPTNVHLDGELYMGRGLFQDTVSIVKSQDQSDRWRNLKFMVFDIPSLKLPFEERYEALQQRFSDHPFAKVAPHSKCQGQGDLLRQLEIMNRVGGEGLMLRQPKSKYARSRSNSLLKVKTFHDDEAIVIGYGSAGKGKYKGMAGSLLAKNRAGVTFKVGAGLTDAQRENPPKKGTIITYRYQELTKAGKPRFPTFVGIAIDKEWTE